MGFWQAFLKFFRRYIPFVARHWNHYEIRGLEHVATRGSKLLAINHGGAWDYDNFLIMSALDHVATSDPARKRIWLFAWDKWCSSTGGMEGYWSDLYRQFSAIPIHIEKKGKPPIPWGLVDEIVERGELMCICPEGHSAARNEGYRLWRFYPGVIKVHLRCRIPIIPCAHLGLIENIPFISNRYDPGQLPPWVDEMPVPVPFMLPRKVILHLGRPIEFDEYYGKEADRETMERLAATVRGEVARIIALYREGVTWDEPYGTRVASMFKHGAES